MACNVHHHVATQIDMETGDEIESLPQLVRIDPSGDMIIKPWDPEISKKYRINMSKVQSDPMEFVFDENEKINEWFGFIVRSEIHLDYNVYTFSVFTINIQTKIMDFEWGWFTNTNHNIGRLKKFFITRRCNKYVSRYNYGSPT